MNPSAVSYTSLFSNIILENNIIYVFNILHYLFTRFSLFMSFDRTLFHADKKRPLNGNKNVIEQGKNKLSQKQSMNQDL